MDKENINSADINGIHTTKGKERFAKGHKASFKEVVFPVSLHDLAFKKGKKDGWLFDEYFPIEGFYAVVADDNDTPMACVTSNYVLYTNREAYNIGLEIAKEIFHTPENATFENPWNYLTATRGACNMDLKHKFSFNC